MPRFSTLFAPIRQSLLERDDPFDPFQPLDEVRRKRPPVSLPHSATADYPAEWRLDPSTAGP